MTARTPMQNPAAERMRRSRQRRRDGLRFFGVELRATEIDTLVARGLLHPDQKDDYAAVVGALYAFLEETLR